MCTLLGHDVVPSFGFRRHYMFTAHASSTKQTHNRITTHNLFYGTQSEKSDSNLDLLCSRRWLWSTCYQSLKPAHRFPAHHLLNVCDIQSCCHIRVSCLVWCRSARVIALATVCKA